MPKKTPRTPQLFEPDTMQAAAKLPEGAIPLAEVVIDGEKLIAYRLPDDQERALADALNIEAERLIADGIVDADGNLVRPHAVPVEPVATPRLPDASSADWETIHIPKIEARIAEARAHLAALLEEADLVELNLLLAHDGAETQAAEHIETVRRAREALDSLQRARARAERELVTAREREATADLQRQRERVAALVDARLALLAQLDAGLRWLGPIADKIASNGVQLGAYELIHRTSRQRLQLGATFQGAVHAGAPALAHLLDLSRDKPLFQMRSAVEVEEALWSRVTGRTSRPARRFEPQQPPVEADELMPDVPAPFAAEPVEVPEPVEVIEESPGYDMAHGAEVLVAFDAGGRKVVEGDILTPEECRQIPTKNLNALVRVRYIQPITPAPHDQAVVTPPSVDPSIDSLLA